VAKNKFRPGNKQFVEVQTRVAIYEDHVVMEDVIAGETKADDFVCYHRFRRGASLVTTLRSEGKRKATVVRTNGSVPVCVVLPYMSEESSRGRKSLRRLMDSLRHTVSDHMGKELAFSKELRGNSFHWVARFKCRIDRAVEFRKTWKASIATIEANF